MTSIKGHFDGTAVVLDEPATLAVGQAVRIIVESELEADRDIADMTDDELAEWLEVETHKLRGVPYNHHTCDGERFPACIRRSIGTTVAPVEGTSHARL
jgi:hypothetical protein